MLNVEGVNICCFLCSFVDADWIQIFWTKILESCDARPIQNESTWYISQYQHPILFPIVSCIMQKTTEQFYLLCFSSESHRHSLRVHHWRPPQNTKVSNLQEIPVVLFPWNLRTEKIPKSKKHHGIHIILTPTLLGLLKGRFLGSFLLVVGNLL